MTATLAAVTVVGCGGTNGAAFITRMTGAGSNAMAAVTAQAFEYVNGLIRGAQISLLPPPGREPAVTANVRVGRDDLAAMLLEAGLAIVDTNLPGGSGLLAMYQQRALDAERGIWKPEQSLAERFSVASHVSLESYDQRSGKPSDLGLPRFHAADLVRAPAVRLSEGAEHEVSIATLCIVDCDISAHGPPKSYDVDVELVPQLKANQYSGPLSSFQPAEGSSVRRSFKLHGGESERVRFESREEQLSRVTRAADIYVYSGALISGYILNVVVDGTVVNSSTGEFEEAFTLDLL